MNLQDTFYNKIEQSASIILTQSYSKHARVLTFHCNCNFQNYTIFKTNLLDVGEV